MMRHGSLPTEPSPEESETANVVCATALASTREAIVKSWQNLRFTNLQYTDLAFSQLFKADLHGAFLMHAYLQGANLRCANLSDAKFDEAKIVATAKKERLTTDTTLVNTYSSKPGNSQITLKRSISLPDQKWHDWKDWGFKKSALKELLASDFPPWAERFSEDVCEEWLTLGQEW
jgi:hypothetical protein